MPKSCLATKVPRVVSKANVCVSWPIVTSSGVQTIYVTQRPISSLSFKHHLSGNAMKNILVV